MDLADWSGKQQRASDIENGTKMGPAKEKPEDEEMKYEVVLENAIHACARVDEKRRLLMNLLPLKTFSVSLC